MLKRVDFPAPFGPINPKIFPGLKSKEICVNACFDYDGMVGMYILQSLLTVTRLTFFEFSFISSDCIEYLNLPMFGSSNASSFYFVHFRF